MAKDKQAPASAEPKTQRAWSLRRFNGMWLYEAADIPEDVFRRYVTEEHEDLFGMCASKLEVDMARLRDRD